LLGRLGCRYEAAPSGRKGKEIDGGEKIRAGKLKRKARGSYELTRKLRGGEGGPSEEG